MRLPKWFTIPLIVSAFFYFFLAFPYLTSRISELYEWLNPSIKGLFPDQIQWWAKALVWSIKLSLLILSSIASSLLIFGATLFGIWLSHWIASKIYYFKRRMLPKLGDIPLPEIPVYVEKKEGAHNPLAGYKKIGIILSGGGAKGAYQAGAMKAIYEFLEEHNAHDKVQTIAATSIGSWNALFWLSNLIKGSNGKPGALERWWSEVNVQKVILPVRYIPTQQNFLLSNEPWKEEFDRIFKDTAAGACLMKHVEEPDDPSAVHFYFTRSNIGKAELDFTTNRKDLGQVEGHLTIDRARPVVVPGTYWSASKLEDIREGVFASMDIPPLFQYSKSTLELENGQDADFFEDGGVIENLPIRFGTEFEKCDLLFILPLNASFEREVNHKSILRRLARVTEIRQGVLERNSFKMIYLFNELASLRKRIEELEEKIAPEAVEGGSNSADPKALSESDIAERARNRSHGVVHVFAICPAPELLISTTEFWKTEEAGKAFDFMYRATKSELRNKFDELVNSPKICMALVKPAKKSTLPFGEDYEVEQFDDF